MSQGKAWHQHQPYFFRINLFTFTFYFANTSKDFQSQLTRCVLISAVTGQSLSLHFAPIFSYLLTNCILE